MESHRKENTKHANELKSTGFPKSVSVSSMLKKGKLINPETDNVTLRIEEFSIADEMSWLEPVNVNMSVQRKPFAEGAFRKAYMAKALYRSSQRDCVLKKYKKRKWKELQTCLGP
ncbi:Hypothetical predicted protein [Paramuricea clavata]|uniref:Uncharacterized protein n=1 Tax=Paramuricea clavata TaxID=317549 RepID=A0A7D9K920_PARCT|nr:Hypothetical predicted protein [Paramuricea clavata]